MVKKNTPIKINSINEVNKDFPKDVFKILYGIEEKHFWFWGRNKIITQEIGKFIKTKNSNILEIGCGTGFVLSHLEKMGYKTTGLDIYPEALKYARKRTKSQLICANIQKDEIPGRYDAVGLFDVLEHIDDDASFLKSTKKLLKRNGMLFITVPADKKLWSISDQLSGHKRRYNVKMLQKVLEKAKFTIEEIKYFGFLLYLPQFILRKLKTGKSALTFRDAFLQSYQTPRDWLNFLGKVIYLVESLLFQTLTFPFGSSLIVVARKI